MADNDAILAFMSSQPMSAGLQMRFDRSPDFFAMPRVHSDVFETHLFVQDGTIVALASLVLRDGYINGTLEKVAYLCDLRVEPSRKLAGRWHRLFMKRMSELALDKAARYAFTVILRENHSARNALVTRKRFGYELVRGFQTISILARKPWGKRASELTIRHADESDIRELKSFLDSTNKAQPFGMPFTGETFEQRLMQWPHLKITSFLLAIDNDGELQGCLAPWDYSSVKRVVIDFLPFGAEWLRKILNLSAPFMGKPVINKPPNAHLPDIAITHVAIKDRRPDVFSALLDVAVTELNVQRRFTTISLCLYDNDPLWPAMNRYWYYSVSMDLYSVRMTPNAPAIKLSDKTIPGFEFYLA